MLPLFKKVKKFRKEKKCTQKDFAKQLGYFNEKTKEPFDQLISRLEGGKLSNDKVLEIANKIISIYDLEENHFNSEIYFHENNDPLKIGISHSIHSTPFISLILRAAYHNAKIFSYKDEDDNPRTFEIENELKPDSEEFNEIKYNNKNGRSRINSVENLKRLLYRNQIDCFFTHELKDNDLIEVGSLLAGVDAVIKPLVIVSRGVFEAMAEKLEKENRIITLSNDIKENHVDRFKDVVYQIEDFTSLQFDNNTQFKIISVREHISREYVQYFFNKNTIPPSLFSRDMFEEVRANNLQGFVESIITIFHSKNKAKEFSEEIQNLDSISKKEKLIKKSILNIFNSDEPKILFLFYWQPELAWLYSIIKDLNSEFLEDKLGTRIVETTTLFPNVNKKITFFNLYINQIYNEKILDKILELFTGLKSEIRILREHLENYDPNYPNQHLEDLSKYLGVHISSLVRALKKLRFRVSFSPNFLDEVNKYKSIKNK